MIRVRSNEFEISLLSSLIQQVAGLLEGEALAPEADPIQTHGDQDASSKATQGVNLHHQFVGFRLRIAKIRSENVSHI